MADSNASDADGKKSAKRPINKGDYTMPQLHVRIAGSTWGPSGAVLDPAIRETGVYQLDQLSGEVVFIDTPAPPVVGYAGSIGTLGGKTLKSLPTGVIVFAGLSGSGKSAYLRSIARRNEWRHVSMAEPDGESTQPHPGIVPMVLKHVDKGVVVFDSLRAHVMLADLPGKGGIPRDFALFLTSLDYLARLRKQTILATVNFMAYDEAVLQTAIELVDASVAGMIIVRGLSRGQDGRTFSVAGTGTFRPNARRRESYMSGLESFVPIPDGQFVSVFE